MKGNFTEVKPLRYWVQHILPLVYDDSLSYMELLGKVINILNEVVKNNNMLPDYITELIKDYISSGEFEKVLAEVLANYMLNVKFPPAGLKPATGDGSADDTEAIQGCIDYAYNNGGMSVYFPSGSYLTQPLTLRDKATLFGQDRYTTRLVMKGGATTAMFTGDVDELTLTGLGFDGNMDIQVNNVNLFTISVNSAIITNCLLTDGYDLLNITVNDDLQLNDVIFKHAVENALVLKGAGIVQGNNLIFKSVSALVGKNFVVMDVSKSILEQLKCYGASPNAVLINGSNNVVKMWNEQSLKAYTDNGNNNTVEVYTQSEQKKLTGFKTTNVSGDLTETVGGNKTESITGNKSVSVHDLTETVTGNYTKTVTGDISESAKNFKVVIQLAYELTANKLTEQLASKEVNATNSTENLGNKTETITGEKEVNANDSTENIANEKHVIAGSVTEDITGDKHVNAANSIETVQGDKTVTAGDISETAVNKTVHITKDNTEQIDGNRTLTVAGNIEESSANRTEEHANTHTENTKNKILNTENLEINSTLPIKYKKPVTNGNIVTIPMRDTDDNEYNVLCEGTKLANSTFSPYLFVGHDQEAAALIIGYTTDFSTFIPMAKFNDIIARDPQIIFLNGIYYICCTYYAPDYSYDTVIYTTADFVNWTRHNINLGISNGPTWAPELAFNNGTLYIFYAHTENEDYTGMKIYRSTCTDINNLSFNNGVLVTGIPENKIDPSIFYNPVYGYTVLIVKNESSKNNDMYDYDFETNTCSNWRMLNIPPHVEAVSCYSVGRYVAIIADRYLAPNETKYGTQNILSTITSDLKNISLTLKMTNCFYNPNKEKVSNLRHVACLKITEDMEQVLISHIGSLTPIAINRNNPYPEHVNIEDYGALSGNAVTITDFIPYPNTVYCIFNNPTGVTTPTTAVNLNSIINYFNLFDLYIYIGSDVNKTLTISTREGVTTINLTAADKDRFIHLRQGIDTKWSVVKGF